MAEASLEEAGINPSPPVEASGNVDDAKEPGSTAIADEKNGMKETKWVTGLWKFITWTPKRCRWDPEEPPKFNMALNLLFGFACTFTVANLYYNHPILNILAVEFDISDEAAALVPTIMQAGYACGLLFLCPLGDIFPRRPFVLTLVFFTASVWLGLCITTSYPLFLTLSFLTALTTVTPQLMLPLVGDLAPPHRRATALSIVVSGLLLGMLIARLLAGILTQYTSWRSVYFLALALQYLIFILLWLFMPDYPSTNPAGLNYFKMLWSIVSMLLEEPVLVQACIVAIFVSTTFTSFWTTLTFLLAGEPYEFNPVQIGLFALIGIASIMFGPFYSRWIIDKLPPLHSVLLGCIYILTGLSISTATGTHTLAGPILCAFLLDFGLQTTQIANRTAIYAIAPLARNRVNTAYMVAVFCGQLVGTAVGNHVYAEGNRGSLGGWKVAGATSIGFIGMAILVVLGRGPWEGRKRWGGWRGGWGLREKGAVVREGDVEEGCVEVEGVSSGEVSSGEASSREVKDLNIGEDVKIPETSEGKSDKGKG